MADPDVSFGHAHDAGLVILDLLHEVGQDVGGLQGLSVGPLDRDVEDRILLGDVGGGGTDPLQDLLASAHCFPSSCSFFHH